MAATSNRAKLEGIRAGNGNVRTKDRGDIMAELLFEIRNLGLKLVLRFGLVLGLAIR